MSSSVLAAAAALVVLLILALVAFQVALALGVSWGRAAYGGAHDGELPPRLRLTSAVAALVWSAVLLVLLRRAGRDVPAVLPDPWLGVVPWVVLGVLVLAAVLNAITPSRLERAIWLPVTVLLASGTTVIALAPLPG